MKIAILADIHDDSVAFDTIIKKIHGQFDEIWSLGDVVGYGVHDDICLTHLRTRVDRWVTGNHEEMLRVVINSILNLDYRLGEDRFFDIYEQIYSYWQQQKYADVWDRISVLSTAILEEYHNLAYLYKTRKEVVLSLMLSCVLGAGTELNGSNGHFDPWENNWHWFFQQIIEKAQEPIKVVDDISGYRMVLVHGSPASINEYIYPWSGSPWNKKEIDTHKIWANLMKNIQNLSCPGRRLVILMGHTHIPLYCPIDDDRNLMDLDATKMAYKEELPLGDWATLINPGSMGHPRDLDARAAYAIVDTDKSNVTYYREEIDRKIIIRRMRKHYYPSSLQLEYLNAPAPTDDECKLNILNNRKLFGKG